MFVQDTSTEWDISTMTRTPSVATKLYILFLLIACVVAGVRLFEAWRGAARLKKAAQPAQPEYFQELWMKISGVKRWIHVTFLAWGICLCFNMGKNLTYLRSYSRELQHPLILLTMLSDYLVFSTMAVLVVTLLYLSRWYMLTRLERAR